MGATLLPATPLRWRRRGQDRHRFVEPTQDMLAERLPGAGHRAGKRAGGENGIAQLFGEVLHANNFVDRGSDQRELQPLGDTDIAVNNFAEVERNAEIERNLLRSVYRCVGGPALAV